MEEGEGGGKGTWRRREKGRHWLKVALERKLWKKAGQLGVVKLFPRLESKGLGRELESVDGGAVLMLDGGDVDEEASLWLVDGVVDSCLACSRIGWAGGSLRSKIRSVRCWNGCAKKDSVAGAPRQQKRMLTIRANRRLCHGRRFKVRCVRCRYVH